MREHEVRAPERTSRRAKRLGRGLGSGKGTYSGKGMKGQKARSGVHMIPGFEGGQNRMIKGLPRQRGFRNRFRVEYQVVNVEALERFDPETLVSPLEMLKAGLVRNLKTPVKVLGQGKLSKPLAVQANRFSASAKQKIEKAKGTVEQIDAAAAAI